MHRPIEIVSRPTLTAYKTNLEKLNVDLCLLRFKIFFKMSDCVKNNGFLVSKFRKLDSIFTNFVFYKLIFITRLTITLYW